MDYEIKQLLFDDGDVSLQKVVDLQNIVYEGSHTFKVKGFRQWYLNNPMGKVISFNAQHFSNTNVDKSVTEFGISTRVSSVHSLKA